MASVRALAVQKEAALNRIPFGIGDIVHRDLEVQEVLRLEHIADSVESLKKKVSSLNSKLNAAKAKIKELEDGNSALMSEVKNLESETGKWQ